MTTRFYTVVAALVLLLIGSRMVPATAVDSSRHLAWQEEAAVLDQDIAFYRARVARDPEGALDRAKLGGLYLQRARQTGSPEDLVRAEQVARESFGLRTRKNAIAAQVLALSLMGQHRFTEALVEARLLVEDDSSSISNRSLLGEIEMELGLYPAADSVFEGLRSWKYKLTVAPRLARWEELNGHPDNARSILLDARTDALKQPNLPLEQKAWFDLRIGDLAFRSGHLGEAERNYLAGLAISPEDYRLLAAMTRLESARRRWNSAIDYGERAIGLVPDPATLGLLGDAYAARGDSAGAEMYYHTMETVVLKQPGAFHRAWSLFLLDHNRSVGVVLAKVQDEIRQRKDIYGYDLLAWALYKNGHPVEARAAMHLALRLGTQDPQLFHHAQVINSAAAHATPER
jgi:tetratricopeptide (TPR) repeat protein